MFNFFTKRRNHQHETKITNLERELLAKENQITYLVKTIREMDDQIFKMGQMMSWESMRPFFAALHEQTMARKVNESNRIRDILLPELNATYQDKSTVPQIPRRV